MTTQPDSIHHDPENFLPNLTQTDPPKLEFTCNHCDSEFTRKELVDNGHLCPYCGDNDWYYSYWGDGNDFIPESNTESNANANGDFNHEKP